MKWTISIIYKINVLTSAAIFLSAFYKLQEFQAFNTYHKLSCNGDAACRVLSWHSVTAKVLEKVGFLCVELMAIYQYWRLSSLVIYIVYFWTFCSLAGMLHFCSHIAEHFTVRVENREPLSNRSTFFWCFLEDFLSCLKPHLYVLPLLTIIRLYEITLPSQSLIEELRSTRCSLL